MPGIYGPVDLVKNELRNAVIQNLGTAPAAPLKGQIYFDSSVNILYWYNGTSWVAAQPGAGLTPAATVTTQAVGDAPVVGTGPNYAREDHKHGRESFGNVTAETTFGGASSNGAAATVARSDHTHGNPAAPVLPGAATTVSTQAVGDVGVVGAATTYAREDHKHGRESFGFVTLEQTFGSAPSNGSQLTVSRSDHLHGNPTHVDADHSAIHLNALAAPTAAVSMNNQPLTNLPAPVNGGDATNKTYVDNAVAGLTWKIPVRFASAAGTSYSTPITGLAAVWDGFTPVAGDRILIKDNNGSGGTAPSTNGIYIASAGTWTRATDADASAELVNAAVYVSEGATNADTAWVCTTNAPITVDTTPLTFVQFAGGGTVTAGAGMTQAGNVLNVIAGDSTLVVNADEMHVGIIPNANLANMTAGTVKGRVGSTGVPTDLGAAQVQGMLSVFSNFTPGLVPGAPGGANTQFLRADATWQAIPVSPQKFATTLAGTASPEVITHNLNTRDIQLTVLNGASPYTAVMVDWDATTVNTATVRYNPTLGAGYRVVVVG